MAHKIVCIACRIAFNRGLEEDKERTHQCPGCEMPMMVLSHRFQPPKRNNSNGWETVQYLLSSGFHYQQVLDNDCEIPYPMHLKDAREFVEKYKDQALKTE